ncbi:MAG: glycosyl hydrolase 115 family protein [Lachnospiraceae bacterium]|nr:glycosyl hydrolase 115 family protein [Lachnospiraceae bacterium]
MEARIEKNTKINIIVLKNEYAGIKRIAGKVANDIELVLDTKPVIREADHDEICSILSGEKMPDKNISGNKILSGKRDSGNRISGNKEEGLSVIACCTENLKAGFGTDEIDKRIADIRGKREVYSFLLYAPDAASSPVLMILGSDKRGTIYGLFHISELLHVSPWIWFADALPAKLESFTLSDADNVTSKEPSVKYRGFFINDEWPSFGSWTMEHFGGFTAEMYEHVFELILRLKGNYLWPAMWTSNFSLDGPGLKNAELADEMGIVMSNSHHEPCLRHSEEWDLVRGEDSVYGNIWNFDRNREGLINYWRDGLKRNGRFENIITIGMRGERDSEILGHEAGLKENIEYLKDVITTQKSLIKEVLGDDAEKVPTMLAVYKEVESYYQGDDKTEGLKYWPGLDGVTLMLCEDNQGNMRTLPDASEINRPGGFGMYYHFDYHGAPVSYEWINSTHLPKVWEQMSEAYEKGIRDIWIVNVGDLKPQELPLSYFMELAYDQEKWGSDNPDSPSEYLGKWIRDTFGHDLSEDVAEAIRYLLDGYTYLNSIRKPESLYPDTYHSVNYGEADALLSYCKDLKKMAECIRGFFAGSRECICEDEDSGKKLLLDCYDELVWFPVLATVNQHEMMLSAGKNECLAAQGRISANLYAEKIESCVKRERNLKDHYHRLNGGKWSGMMSSEHVGFEFWNEEENRYPVRKHVYRAAKERLVVSLPYSDAYTMGGDWTAKRLYITDFLMPDRDSAFFVMENSGYKDIKWEAETDVPWLEISFSNDPCHRLSGILEVSDEYTGKNAITAITVTVNRKLLNEGLQNAESDEREAVSGFITVKTPLRKVEIEVFAYPFTDAQLKTEHLIPVSSESIGKKLHPVFAPGPLPGLRRKATEGDDIGLCMEISEYDHIENTDASNFVLIENYGKYGNGLKAYPTASYTPGADAPCAVYKVHALRKGNYDLTMITGCSNPIDGRGVLEYGLRVNDEEIRCINMIKPGFKGGDHTGGGWSEDVMRGTHEAVTEIHLEKGPNEIRIYAKDPGIVFERLLIREEGTAWAEGFLGPVPERFKKG